MHYLSTKSKSTRIV